MFCKFEGAVRGSVTKRLPSHVLHGVKMDAGRGQ